MIVTTHRIIKWPYITSRVKDMTCSITVKNVQAEPPQLSTYFMKKMRNEDLDDLTSATLWLRLYT